MHPSAHTSRTITPTINTCCSANALQDRKHNDSTSAAGSKNAVLLFSMLSLVSWALLLLPQCTSKAKQAAGNQQLCSSLVTAVKAAANTARRDIHGQVTALAPSTPMIALEHWQSSHSVQMIDATHVLSTQRLRWACETATPRAGIVLLKQYDCLQPVPLSYINEIQPPIPFQQTGKKCIVTTILCARRSALPPRICTLWQAHASHFI